MLYHAFDEGGHVFSPAGQPTVWTTQSYHPYNRTVGVERRLDLLRCVALVAA